LDEVLSVARHKGEQNMENITFNFVQLHQHGPAFSDFLRLRKHFFVDTLGWDIPHDDDVEMDQYDNPQASYSLAIRDGEVVGGVRVMPTTAKWGNHSYMLRDAFHGKLIDIPTSVLSEEILSPTVWEGTRIVVSDRLQTHAERAQCLSTIMDGMIDIVASQGGERIMALCPLAMMRALRKRGYDVNTVGNPHHNTGDGRRYAVLTMPAQKAVEGLSLRPSKPIFANMLATAA
jgi:acyl homoserine lactone synthase